LLRTGSPLDTPPAVKTAVLTSLFTLLIKDALEEDVYDAELPSITVEAMVQFQREFPSRMHMDMLVHGNLDKKDAIGLADVVAALPLHLRSPT